MTEDVISKKSLHTGHHLIIHEFFQTRKNASADAGFIEILRKMSVSSDFYKESCWL